MIIGIGIDIIEVDRVAEKIGKANGFKEKIFSPDEIAFCDKGNSFENYAVRFAAKEAFLKATGKGLLLGHELKHIEVVHDENGKPFVRLHDHFAKLASDNNWNQIHLSLSHIKAAACAVVIIES
jgi:holo-[acyl-carrier protein] synthase